MRDTAPRGCPNERTDAGSVSHRSVKPIDGALFDDLVRRYKPTIWAVARALTRTCEGADEVSQEVFLRYWTRSEAFDPDRGSLEAWLKMMARGIAIDWVRRETRHSNLTAAGPAGWLDERQEERLVSAVWLAEALATLSQVQSTAITLAFIDGLPYRAVASVLNISEGTAKSRIRLGLRHLALLL